MNSIKPDSAGSFHHSWLPRGQFVFLRVWRWFLAGVTGKVRPHLCGWRPLSGFSPLMKLPPQPQNYAERLCSMMEPALSFPATCFLVAMVMPSLPHHYLVTQGSWGEMVTTESHEPLPQWSEARRVPSLHHSLVSSQRVTEHRPAFTLARWLLLSSPRLFYQSVPPSLYASPWCSPAFLVSS